MEFSRKLNYEFKVLLMCQLLSFSDSPPQTIHNSNKGSRVNENRSRMPIKLCFSLFRRRERLLNRVIKKCCSPKTSRNGIHLSGTRTYASYVAIRNLNHERNVHHQPREYINISQRNICVFCVWRQKFFHMRQTRLSSSFYGPLCSSRYFTSINFFYSIWYKILLYA